MNIKTIINQKQEVCFCYGNLPQLKMEEEEDNKPESKPNKMLDENAMRLETYYKNELHETYYKNVKEVSCLAVGQICVM